MNTKSDKVQKIIVDNDHSGQRLDNFLLNFLKGVPKSKIYSIIRKGEVRVNSSRKKVSYKIIEDDLIRIPPLNLATVSKNVPSSSFIKVLQKNIIYEDNNCLVINKPCGVASHGGSGLSIGLIEAIRNFG